MCGIAGFIDQNHSLSNEALQHTALAMAKAIEHRGPDDAGVWSDASHGISLSHRRLSIIDLSKEGHQPMASASGRYVMVFNGEIYNFQELRTQFSISWRGHSDTEVMLAAIEAYGLAKALTLFNGMFAFALWDKQEKTLTLARDRVGEKPLYYGVQGKNFVFASELNALKQHDDWNGQIDRDALALLIQYNYIPSPYCIYKGLNKLQPGHYLTYDQKGETALHCYWDHKQIVTNGLNQPLALSETEAVALLEEKLSRSVSNRMIADVPLGAFLSGGIDSSSIVAMMQKNASNAVKTFSIGFDVEGYNEAVHAKTVAKHLKTEHTELYVTPKDALDVIPKIPTLYDEPFADSSQIPTFLVAKMAREHVTVALSGDGGDELFGGYNRYFWVENIWKKIGKLPLAARKSLAKTITTIPVSMWDKTLGLLLKLAPEHYRYSNPGDKFHKLADLFSVRNPDEMYHLLVSMWSKPEQLVKRDGEPLNHHFAHDFSPAIKEASIAERMMYQDLIGYLPGDILTKVDRAAMGVSLETRIPLLDHELIEFAWQLPLSMKIRDGKGKWILRELLYKYVPKTLIERPKAGFAIPIDHWLRTDLRDWAESLLDEHKLASEGYFHPKFIRQCWQEHLSGRRNWQYHLWGVLMFQAWKEHQHG